MCNRCHAPEAPHWHTMVGRTPRTLQFCDRCMIALGRRMMLALPPDVRIAIIESHADPQNDVKYSAAEEASRRTRNAS